MGLVELVEQYEYEQAFEKGRELFLDYVIHRMLYFGFSPQRVVEILEKPMERVLKVQKYPEAIKLDFKK